MTRHTHLVTVLALSGWLAACASGPKTPDWQLEAKGSMERAVSAYMEGNNRVEATEVTRAREQLSRTGKAEVLANAELLRCATRVASLVFEVCSGFEALRPDASAAQRAYADYLQGQVNPANVALLPEAQRRAASGDANAVAGIEDPLSRLVAAGVLLQTGQATPAVLSQAVDTASAQGWRRPLLAWLGVQVQRADQAADTNAAARLRRRIALVEGQGRSSP